MQTLWSTHSEFRILIRQKQNAKPRPTQAGRVITYQLLPTIVSWNNILPQTTGLPLREESAPGKH